jgi:predicted nucleotidyltransferase
MREYRENGARLGLLIDPEERRVHAYRERGEVEILEAPAAVSGDPILPGFTMSWVLPLWGHPCRPPQATESPAEPGVLVAVVAEPIDRLWYDGGLMAATVTEAALHRAGDLLERRFGVDTLWLFGSAARGEERSDSDLDLAALFRRRPAALDLLDARGELADLLGREVDLVDLDRASPILGMQVLRTGRLLVDRNPGRRYAFVGRTISMYEDVKILRREAERTLLQRVSGGRS